MAAAKKTAAKKTAAKTTTAKKTAAKKTASAEPVEVPDVVSDKPVDRSGLRGVPHTVHNPLFTGGK